ncbi:methylmalonyl-CoA epimerase [Halonotius pteroides]|uniref:Methylmalonyl-CoA epimerase n=1 Tax=Halonotius pteroides TaxID=268735 RepID=A0A3A6QLK4_9EURY|nr:methylmalonyl-CoA epimerase [Halonotius pteroides]RJX48647.1 methylmalonyl-CoA epimerase [Halonotius pteroides]
MNFHHAGIATNDAAAVADRYAALFDAPIVHEERFDGMAVNFLDLGSGYFELLEPHDDGPIAHYLDSHGPGIHHLALSTADIEAALTRAAEQGIDRIDDEPRPGAWGHEVAFLHPSSTGGVLIEIVAE